MQKIKARPATAENIAPYGSLVMGLDPSGFALRGDLHSFYADRLRLPTADSLCLSPLVVKKPERYIINALERHEYADEIIIALDDDVIIHLTPPSGGGPDTSQSEAFILPKGAALQLRSAVWHLAPLPVHADEVHCLILLPERTYARDCEVLELAVTEQFEIEF